MVNGLCPSCGQAMTPEAAATKASAPAPRTPANEAPQTSRHGMNNRMIGGLICGIGTVITIGTYAAASGGGTYVAWGAIIFGGIRMITGLFQIMIGRG